MPKVSLRPERVTDAKALLRIISNQKFFYYRSAPKRVKGMVAWLKQNAKLRRKKREFNYVILYEGKVVGEAGFFMDADSRHAAQGRYCVDEEYWGNGIATEAFRLVEKIAFNDMKLVRLELRIHPKNKHSLRVAKKLGYKKEGFLRKKGTDRAGNYIDLLIYAKVK
jgi:ribosomal-protein-alanine N-acetyltransferase